MKNFEMDHDLHMVRESVKEPNMNHLEFLRSLADAGKFDTQPLSQPRGDFVFRLSDERIKFYAMRQANQTTAEKLRAHIAATGGK